MSIRSRVVSAGDERPGALQRAGELTPYAAETICEDAVRAGPGARLEVTVDAGTDDAGLGRVQDQFAWLRARGIQVNVHRVHRGKPLRTHPEVAALIAKHLSVLSKKEGAMIRELDTRIGTVGALEAASASMRRDHAGTDHTLDLTVPVMVAIVAVVLLYLASRDGAIIAEELTRWAYALSQLLGLFG